MKKKRYSDQILDLDKLKIKLVELIKVSSAPLNFQKIFKKLKLSKNKYFEDQLSLLLKNLIADQTINQLGENFGYNNSKFNFYKGIVERKSSGKVFILYDNPNDAYVSKNNSNNLFTGDEVNFILTGKVKAKNPEAKVLKIIKRIKTTFVGIININSNYSFFIPDNHKVGTDFYIPKDKIGSAKDGYKVMIEFIEWPKKAKNPIGKVIKVFGESGEHLSEINSIMSEYNLNQNFPKQVLIDVNNISDKISPIDIKKRKDYRDILTFTIDPDDAKDFDDAISIYKISKSIYEVGIHIADVSHYLKEDSEIDKEAFKRATSIYLVDRVIPMLPERLSNNICSLTPNNDKLCFSAIFRFDENNKIIYEWYGKTVINSDYRFTYDQVEKIIIEGKGKFFNEIIKLNTIASNLRKDRVSEGAIIFDRVEVKFKLDDNYNPKEIFFKKSKNSNKLVEEFMLLTNRKVAELIGKESSGKIIKEFIYRIHDKPDKEKLYVFSNIAKKMGFQLNYDSDTKLKKSIINIMDKVKNREEKNLIEILAIKSMSKAIYSTKNIGHYGLSFNFYTHFTSPIRRWPDVIVHRLLNSYLNKKQNIYSLENLENQCLHSVNQEKIATEAERQSIKFMKVKYLIGREGDYFEAIVSGITEYGIFIEIIESLTESFIPIKELKDDYYEFSNRSMSLRGKNFFNTIRLGDKIKVLLKSVDLVNKRISLDIV